ncbi:MAG: hypothetical protein S4CHLAM2_00930 [Chlamydiales bacterium]|nr:hypothetical protein [Chlamydiales bacterium]
MSVDSVNPTILVHAPLIQLTNRNKCLCIAREDAHPQAREVKALIARLGLSGAQKINLSRGALTLDGQPHHLAPSDQRLVQICFNEGALPFEGVRVQIKQDSRENLPDLYLWIEILGRVKAIKDRLQLSTLNSQYYQLIPHCFRDIRLKLSQTCCTSILRAHGHSIYALNYDLDWTNGGVHHLPNISTYCPSLSELRFFAREIRPLYMLTSLRNPRRVLPGVDPSIALIQPFPHSIPRSLRVFSFSGGKEVVSADINVRLLAAHLGELTQLRELGLENNALTDAQIEVLAPSLPASIKQLNLLGNKITTVGIQILTKQTINLSVLNVFNLEGTSPK